MSSSGHVSLTGAKPDLVLTPSTGSLPRDKFTKKWLLYS
jgi:hypothetical protein